MVMPNLIASPTQPVSPRLGEILQSAHLISSAQVDVALREQLQFPRRRIGEILSSKGWIRQETVNFLAEEWQEIILTISQGRHRQKLGYYLKRAALLDEQQIEMLLEQQKQGKLWVRLGALATMKGWLNQGTVDFFLEHIFPEQAKDSPFLKAKVRTYRLN